jgi:hypothetical protein
MVMSNVRKLVIVLLATTAVACTIGGLPRQPNQDAATSMGAGGRNIGANGDAANIAPGIEAGASTGGAGTTGIGSTLSGTGGFGGTKDSGGTTGVGRTATGGSSSGATSAGGTSGALGGATTISSGGKTNPTGGTIISSGGVITVGGVTIVGGITGGAITMSAGAIAVGGVTTAGGIITVGVSTGGVTSVSGVTTVGGSTATGGAITISGGMITGGGTNASTAGAGGTKSQTGGNTSAGATTSAGGSIAVTCPAATSYAACTTDAGVVAGAACKPNPPMFALDANCNIGLWASDYTSSGYFFQPWCNNATTPCALTMACATNSMHIAGSYLGSSTAAPMDGNAGWGANLQTTNPDAGLGCQMIDGTRLTGLTLDINVATLPTGNHLDIGISLANGNSADYTAVLTTGPQTVKIPWACFKNKLLCGSVPGPGITSIFFNFDWFNDGATHAVDITLSNIGFY